MMLFQNFVVRQALYPLSYVCVVIPKKTMLLLFIDKALAESVNKQQQQGFLPNHADLAQWFERLTYNQASVRSNPVTKYVCFVPGESCVALYLF